MTWASIATQFVLTVGASLAERLASALSARIKQEPETANPVDIAIATKSAVSADREGKIASEMAKKPSECLHPGVVCEERNDGWYVECSQCKLRAWGSTEQLAIEMLYAMQKTRDTDTVRRLGDYGLGTSELGEMAKKPSECVHPGATVSRVGKIWVKSCPDCGRYVAADTRADVEELWSRSVMGAVQRNRRLGDYGPGGG